MFRICTYCTTPLSHHTPQPLPQKNSFQKEYHSSAFRPHEGEGAYARPLTAPFVVDTVDFGADAPVEKGLTVRSACMDGGGACGLGWWVDGVGVCLGLSIGRSTDRRTTPPTPPHTHPNQPINKSNTTPKTSCPRLPPPRRASPPPCACGTRSISETMGRRDQVCNIFIYICVCVRVWFVAITTRVCI